MRYNPYRTHLPYQAVKAAQSSNQSREWDRSIVFVTEVQCQPPATAKRLQQGSITTAGQLLRYPMAVLPVHGRVRPDGGRVAAA